MILTMAMALHQRKLIRDAVVALLASASTAAGSRVQGTRVDPYKKTGLPAIAVYSLSEHTDDQQSTALEYVRELKLEIVGFVAHTDQVPADDAMDALAEQIEAAMDGNYYLDVARTVTAVDPVTDQLTILGHGLDNAAAPARIGSSGTVPGGLSSAAEYHVIVIDDDHVQLAASNNDALSAAAIDITSAGSGTITLVVSTATDCELTGVELEVVDPDGKSDPLIGEVAMTYAVTYRTSRTKAAANLDDFITADAKQQIAGGVSDTPIAEDTINVRGT